MINLLRFKKNQKYLIADTETCHLNLLDGNYCWNLTYFLYEGQTLKEKYDRFPLWEPLPISKGAAAVTKFNYDEYKRRAEDPVKVLNHFEKFLYDDDIMTVMHNGLGFDIYIINQYQKFLKRKSNYSYLSRFIDTNTLSKAVFLDKKPNPDESLINFQYRMQSFVQKGLKTNVGAMCQHFKIPFDKEQAHRGEYDVARTADIFFQLLYKIDI